jgi:hypothetical protein
MSTASTIIFSVAMVFYLLTWKYIRQLVRDVNETANGERVSIWWWHKGGEDIASFSPRVQCVNVLSPALP